MDTPVLPPLRIWSGRVRALALCVALSGVWLGGERASLAQANLAQVGRWDPDLIKWPNVGIHLSVLPDGKVLFWGRRDWNPNATAAVEGLDPHHTTPFVWDPANPQTPAVPVPDPLLHGGPEEVNLFCSGHTFLPDGRLIVVGGHIEDSKGSHKVRVFDWRNSKWSKEEPMGEPGQGGRWYPTVVTLPNGDVLTLGGQDQNKNFNPLLQVLRNNGQWDTLTGANFEGLPYYPWMYVQPDGRLFLAGWSRPRQTQWLDVNGEGDWEPLGEFNGTDREYGSSVMYDVGKILITGGGIPGQRSAEIIDLTVPNPQWQFTGQMTIGRRHHNATLLPDGTVLITGGTSGNGGPNNGFNDVNTPVRVAELWAPPPPGAPASAGQFIPMAAETESRLYHSAAVLLADGRVLSAGGGEYRPVDGGDPNEPQHSLRNAQIFSPPYLFKGDRPVITSAPEEVAYNVEFDVGTAQPGVIRRISWVRLSSVTHAHNQGQRINFLTFTVQGNQLKVRSPANANVCPPGHYLMFILNEAGVPSVAKVVRVHP
jgi:galactose oxidase